MRYVALHKRLYFGAHPLLCRSIPRRWARHRCGSSCVVWRPSTGSRRTCTSASPRSTSTMAAVRRWPQRRANSQQSPASTLWPLLPHSLPPRKRSLVRGRGAACRSCWTRGRRAPRLFRTRVSRPRRTRTRSRLRCRRAPSQRPCQRLMLPQKPHPRRRTRWTRIRRMQLRREVTRRHRLRRRARTARRASWR